MHFFNTKVYQSYLHTAEYVSCSILSQERLHRLVSALLMASPIYTRLVASRPRRLQLWVSWLHTVLLMP